MAKDFKPVCGDNDCEGTCTDIATGYRCRKCGKEFTEETVKWVLNYAKRW